MSRFDTLELTVDEFTDAPSLDGGIYGYVAAITGGAFVPLHGRLDENTLTARATTSGLRYLVVRTGKKVQYGWAVAVRIIPARDTGDAAGTLAFDWSAGHNGRVNRRVFGL